MHLRQQASRPLAVPANRPRLTGKAGVAASGLAAPPRSALAPV
ncbi:hypothetical protein [Bosea sp. 685]|nr:hypothetical protein [Bosea sp. 685]WNJ89920.1 hypothetical protein RMR04_26600 [Bosea sp. 685]